MKVAQARILTILKSDCDISRGDRMCKQTPIFFQSKNDGTLVAD